MALAVSLMPLLPERIAFAAIRRASSLVSSLADDTNSLPPSDFITAAMDFAMMSPTQWDRVLIADLAAKRLRLRKSQMVSISGSSAANQTRLFGNWLDVVTVANPTWRRQCQYAFVDSGGAALLLASTE
jgi:hypothetical protein